MESIAFTHHHGLVLHGYFWDFGLFTVLLRNRDTDGLGFFIFELHSFFSPSFADALVGRGLQSMFIRFESSVILRDKNKKGILYIRSCARLAAARELLWV